MKVAIIAAVLLVALLATFTLASSYPNYEQALLDEEYAYSNDLSTEYEYEEVPYDAFDADADTLALEATTVYVVKSGDSLSAIAAKFGTTVAKIMAANPSITNANLIYVGQRINIPSGSTPTPTPTPAPSDNKDALRQQVVNKAMSYLGYKYTYGGCTFTKTGPVGIDCSCFVQQIYKSFGYSISRVTSTQLHDGIAVSSLSQSRAGDLVLYDGHVAMIRSCSGGVCGIVHASNPKDGVKTSPTAAYRPILGIRRIIH